LKPLSQAIVFLVGYLIKSGRIVQFKDKLATAKID